jgi:6-phosphogluconolactonase
MSNRALVAYRFALAALFALGCSAPSEGLQGSPRNHGPSSASPDGSTSSSPGADAGGDATAAGDDDASGQPGQPGQPGGDDAGADTGVAPPPANTGPLVAYASGYGPSIARFSVDATTGLLTSKGSIAAANSDPSFLAVNPAATVLYALSEATAGKVSAYAIDKTSGALTHINDVSSQGNGPAHLSVDASGKWVFVANYGDGTVSVLPVQASGGLGNATDTQSVGTNAHMIVADLSNRYVFVPCLGRDYVAQFRFDATAGKLIPNATPHVATAAGAGPRHIAFHPNGKLAYLINETKSTMTAFSLDGATGRLSEIETQSTLPAGFTGANTGAEVWVHPSGKWVMGSNRGHDSIVVFAIDGGTGKMTLKGHTKTGGAMPRDFTLDPSGTFLYAANQGSGTVVPVRVDATQGTLAPAGTSVSVQSATFVGVVRLPAP